MKFWIEVPNLKDRIVADSDIGFNKKKYGRSGELS